MTMNRNNSFGDEDYRLSEDDLYGPDETRRAWAVMDISRRRLKEYETVLLHMLSCDPSTDVRRHVIRALGNIGAQSAMLPILDVLATERGLIAGDAAEALGKLKAEEARDQLIRQSNSKVQWVAQKCRWALKQLSDPAAESID